MLHKCLTGVSAFAIAVSICGAAAAAKPEMAKLGDALTAMYEGSKSAADAPGDEAAAAREDLSGEAAPQRRSRARDASDLFMGRITPDGYVLIDAVAARSAADLATTMSSLGGRSISRRGRIVSGQIPVKQLENLAVSQYLAFASPSLAATNVGLVTSQADRSMRSNEIRQLTGLDGTGLTVGVLSDSFSCAPGSLGGGPFTTTAEDIANNDLPPNVTILKDLIFDGCIDEGRAMAQLIHDVVPGANIAFYTAFDGQADFANGIVALAAAGADVIVDDVIYFAEPMLQDGIIAQAADEVARLGVPYYSSNGNRARDAFESNYRAATTSDGVFHDFDPGAGVDTMNEVVLNGDLQTNLAFNWDSPNFSVSGGAGAQNDVDVIMFDENGVRVAECFDAAGIFIFPANGLCQFQFTDGGLPIDGGAGGDAIELVSLVDFIGGSTVNIGFELQAGAAPGFVKFVVFGGGFASAEYAIDAPSGYGHNNAAGAEGVGAAAFFFTEEFIGDPATLQLRAQSGEAPCIPACLNDFSSAGGTPIFFRTTGQRIEPRSRLKPGITGPDGTNTSFFFSDTSRDDDDGDLVFQTGEPGEFPNFFGTSAAAPNVAAIAALLLDSRDVGILQERDGGNIDFRMCPPNSRGRRTVGGSTQFVAAADVQARMSDGFLLGPCNRPEPATIYDVKRRTAQNMTVRASLGDGTTIQTFTEGVVPASPTFDFDSGFGFVDGVAALRRFTPSAFRPAGREGSGQ